MKWFHVARYTEEDVFSRDYLKPKFCICTSKGFSRRGLHLREWFSVKAHSAADAKKRVQRGEGIKHS
jgi:hypothetical protein